MLLSSAARKLILSTTAAGLASAFSSSASSSAAPSSSSPLPPGVSEWAYPSPYDHGSAPGRFAEVQHLRKAGAPQWDLRGLVDIWRNSKDESWPWVWCDRNPVGPHHVFVNVNAQTLEQVTKVCADDRNNNLTVVVRSLDDLLPYKLTQAQLWANRCAIIEVPLQQIDAEHKIMMLRDERIIVYDFCYLS